MFRDIGPMSRIHVVMSQGDRGGAANDGRVSWDAGSCAAGIGPTSREKAALSSRGEALPRLTDSSLGGKKNDEEGTQ